MIVPPSSFLLDDWAEQKYLEGQGRREVYDYGKPLPTERVVLSSVWGLSITALLGRVVWQVRAYLCVFCVWLRRKIRLVNGHRLTRVFCCFPLQLLNGNRNLF